MKAEKVIQGQLAKLERSHEHYLQMHEERIRKLKVAYEKKKAGLEEELQKSREFKKDLMERNAKKL